MAEELVGAEAETRAREGNRDRGREVRLKVEDRMKIRNYFEAASVLDESRC